MGFKSRTARPKGVSVVVSIWLILRLDPAWHIPIVRFDKDMVAAAKLDMPVGDLFFGSDVKSLPLLGRDGLLDAGDAPCVDHGSLAIL